MAKSRKSKPKPTSRTSINKRNKLMKLNHEIIKKLSFTPKQK
jgi:hypothetical protein